MSAVVTEDRSQLESRQNTLFPGAVDHAGYHHFVPLIKLGDTAVYVDVGRILRSIVTIEICRRVKSFTVGVISEEREVIAEAFFDLHDAALVEGIRLRAVRIILDDQRIHKTLNRRVIAWQTTGFSASQRVSSRCRRIPVAIGNSPAIGQSQRGEGRRKEIGIDSNRESLRVRVDSADRN